MSTQDQDEHSVLLGAVGLCVWLSNSVGFITMNS